jgi:sialic acid synthase SpsE
LAKVQQMHPHMMMTSSASHKQQPSRDQNDEYSQYQKYQEVSNLWDLHMVLGEFVLTQDTVSAGTVQR